MISIILLNIHLILLWLCTVYIHWLLKVLNGLSLSLCLKHQSLISVGISLDHLYIWIIHIIVLAYISRFHRLAHLVNEIRLRLLVHTSTLLLNLIHLMHVLIVDVHIHVAPIRMNLSKLLFLYCSSCSWCLLLLASVAILIV